MSYWYKERNEVIVPKQLIDDICDIFDLVDLNILSDISLNNIQKLKRYKTRD